MKADTTPIEEIPNAWPQSGGFTVPDWMVIGEWVDRNFLKSRLNEAYTQLADFWLARLRDELGGEYKVWKSDDFRVLSAGSGTSADLALHHFRQCINYGLKLLPGIASVEGYGPHVLIMISDADDWYELMKHYSPAHIMVQEPPGAVLVGDGYNLVIAFPEDVALCKFDIFHATSQMVLSHLPLPIWTMEGLVSVMHRGFFRVGEAERQLTPELAAYLCEFWNEKNIAHFWRGGCFFTTNESHELGFYLAELLMDHVKSLPGCHEFLLNATWEDAGEAASIKHLGCSLEEVMALFLGEGNWKPDQPEP